MLGSGQETTGCPKDLVDKSTESGSDSRRRGRVLTHPDLEGLWGESWSRFMKKRMWMDQQMKKLRRKESWKRVQ